MITQCPMCEPVKYGDHEFRTFRVCPEHTKQLERRTTEILSKIPAKETK